MTSYDPPAPSEAAWQMLDEYLVAGRIPPSPAERRLAARIRVRVDIRQRRTTPGWILDLAGPVPEWRSWWERIADRWRFRKRRNVNSH